MQTKKQNKTRKIILCAVFSALAYVAMMTIKIPIVGFLKYEPKDVIIALGSFISGSACGIVISFITCFVEFFTVSDTGPVGFLMNFLSSACFAWLASAIYAKKRTITGAVLGLSLATIATTVLMLIWNYVVTPMYMNVPRSVVADMLIPMFLPFNLLKYALSSAFAMLLYKPVSKAVKLAGFGNVLPRSEGGSTPMSGKRTAVIAVVSVCVIMVCIFLMILLSGNI